MRDRCNRLSKRGLRNGGDSNCKQKISVIRKGKKKRSTENKYDDLDRSYSMGKVLSRVLLESCFVVDMKSKSPSDDIRTGKVSLVPFSTSVLMQVVPDRRDISLCQPVR